MTNLERDMSYNSTSESAVEQEQAPPVTEPLHWRDFITVTKTGIVKSNVLSAAAAFWLAVQTVGRSGTDFSGLSGFLLFLYTCVGTALIIASGCVLNNYLDRDLDKKMERTKHRPSVQRFDSRLLLGYGIVLGIAGTLLLVTLVNLITAVLGLLGIFFYVIVYTLWMKRTTSLNTVVGGLSGAIPPMMGWCAVTGGLDAGAGLLFVIMFLWQPPHFLALAMLRSEEYRVAGFKMLTSESGAKETKWQMLLWTTALVPASLLLYLLPSLGDLYLTVMTILGGFYVAYALQGVYGNAPNEKQWAGKMFGYSLIYLVVMYAVIFVDAAL